MNILCNLKLNKGLEYYFSLPEDTIIYVPQLTFNGGIELIKEALEDENTKVYKGDVRRKTEKSRWLQHLTTGIINPSVFSIKLSNGVKILDYSKFDPKSDVTEEEMMPLAQVLVNEYGAPTTPTAIIRKNIKILNQIQGKNSFGAKVEEIDPIICAYTHKALFGGSVYNMHRNGAYQIVKNETHIDFHQMYAYVMSNYPFPDISYGYEVIPGYQPHPFGIYHICGGKIRLKDNGFPMFTLEYRHDGHRESYFADFKDIPWGYMTEPDLQTLLNNFEVDPKHPIEIDETFYYKRSISGGIIFGDFIDKVYEKRKQAEGSLKRFYKMLNEYLPGSFERKVEDSRFWENLEGPDGKIKITRYNSVIGAFITAYGRQLLDSILHMVPYEKVIGYDTDCLFFAGTPDEVPQKILKRFGDNPGQLHFDGIYTDVRHLSAKQYYGLDNGQPFGKFSAVPNGDEIAKTLIERNDDLAKAPVVQYIMFWNKDKQEYEGDYIPARLSMDNFSGGSKNGAKAI